MGSEMCIRDSINTLYITKSIESIYMNFFKSLKAKLLGSIKEDLNSALNSRRVDFNSKISGALDDLIAMKTGINISNIPQSISEEALLSSEDRKKAEADINSRAEAMGRVSPKQKDIYRFPKSDMRFVDNWIIFRTIPRPISDLGATYGCLLYTSPSPRDS